MTEKTKKRIKKEFDVLLQAVADKEKELLALRTEEEDMPTTQNEALEEVLGGNPEHSASKTTNTRLVEWTEVRDAINAFHEQVLQERSSIPNSEESEYLNTIEEYCKARIEELKRV